MGRLTAVVFGLMVILGVAGCKGGSGGGLFGLFGGNTGGSITSIVENSGGGTSEAVQLAGGSVSSGGAATVINPEPASMVLFGGGLVGLIAARRRKAGRRL